MIAKQSKSAFTRHAGLISLCCLLLSLTACSNLGVDPWERGTLALPEMAVDVQPLISAIEDHTYFSKEASSGGRGFGGGGCGCN